MIPGLSEPGMDGVAVPPDTLIDEYYRRYSAYVILQSRLSNLLPTIIKNAKIDILGVFGRIKELSSFIEKVNRKSYSNPFQDCEDLCGLRVIYYRIADRESIIETIRASCNVLKEEDKTKELGPQEFGYGSYHLVAGLAPEHMLDEMASLIGYVAEIQVTSVAEHMWANISHKLDYKKTESPSPERRHDLFKLRALLEVCDDLTQELLNENRLPPSLTSRELRDFFDMAFPDREKIEDSSLPYAVQRFLPYVDSVSQLEQYWSEWRGKFPQIEREVYTALRLPGRWREDGALTTLLDLATDRHWQDFQYFMPIREREVLERWRSESKAGKRAAFPSPKK